MTDRALPLLRLAALTAMLALSGCDSFRGDDKANAAANDTDPEIADALNDQILVDSNLDNQSNRNSARAPVAPGGSRYPAAEGSSGGGKGTDAAAALGKNCADAAKFDYNPGWAKRLSPTFPLYPGARVTEAAANNQAGCSTRVVTFTTGDGWQPVLDWYHNRAVSAGYSSEHQLRDGDHVLGGANPRDNGAFYLIVTPKPNGSEVALIANNGR